MEAVALGERLRDGATEVAGADDGHGQHSGVGCILLGC